MPAFLSCTLMPTGLPPVLSLHSDDARCVTSPPVVPINVYIDNCRLDKCPDVWDDTGDTAGGYGTIPPAFGQIEDPGGVPLHCPSCNGVRGTLAMSSQGR